MSLARAITVSAVVLGAAAVPASAALIVDGAGSNTLTGTPTRDVIHGRAGDDTINGLEGRDRLRGRVGNDAIGCRECPQDERNFDFLEIFFHRSRFSGELEILWCGADGSFLYHESSVRSAQRYAGRVAAG